MEGDIAAIKEIADRVDGKVPQAVQGDAEAPLVINRIVHEIGSGQWSEFLRDDRMMKAYLGA